VAPKVLPAFALHKSFEVDPQEVPELQDYFLELQAQQDPQEGADVGASHTGLAAQSVLSVQSGNIRRGMSVVSAVSGAGSVAPLAPEPPRVDAATKAEVEAALNNAMQAHWDVLDQRLAALPE